MKPSPFSKKQRGRLFLSLIAIVLLLRTFTPIELNLTVGGDMFMNAYGLGNLTPGHQGLLHKGTVIIWDDDEVSYTYPSARKILHESSIKDVPIDPRQIVVRCTLQNEWDWRLFVPFHKELVAKVTGTVWYKGKIIDEINLHCGIKMVGFFGRGYVIKTIKEVVLGQLSAYLYDYTQENHLMNPGPGKISCDAIIGVNFSFFPDSVLQGAPERTHYCLKKGTDLWSDTISYEYFGVLNTSPRESNGESDDLYKDHVSYEVTTFDRRLQRIEHKKFYRDGSLFMCVDFEANPEDEDGLIPPDSIVKLPARIPYYRNRLSGHVGNGEVYDHDGTLIITLGRPGKIYQEMIQTPNGPIPKVEVRKSKYSDWGTWDEEKDGWE